METELDVACFRRLASLIAAGLVCVVVPISASGTDERSRPDQADTELGISSQDLSADENYRRQCAACHGETGRGDGRVARRYNPRPADFQDPQGIVLLTDGELEDIVANGRASMPAFDEVLSPEEITAVVAYIRVLSGHVERVGGNSGSSR